MIKVALLIGGKSTEHEISLKSSSFMLGRFSTETQFFLT